MRRFNANTESRGFSWAYRDLLTALLVVFIAMATLSLVAMVQKPDRRVAIQGNLIFTLHWDGASDSDIDLWIQSPGDSPIGYRRMSGLNCNLLRDDLGHQHDPSSQNQEMAVCRNAPPGAYVVNAVAYDIYDKKLPVQIAVEGFFSDGNGSNRLFERDAKLSYQGQEVTVARFELTKQGTMAPHSLNDIPVLLFRAQR